MASKYDIKPLAQPDGHGNGYDIAPHDHAAECFGVFKTRPGKLRDTLPLLIAVLKTRQAAQDHIQSKGGLATCQNVHNRLANH